MGKIAKYLNQLIVGNVYDDPSILESYATDASILKIKPRYVAFPESTEDVCKLVRFFNQIAAKDIPVSLTPRGAGLDDGGADLSNCLVLSTEKLNHMLEIDTRERLVRVQSGITLKELNTALSVSGLTIPIGGHDNDTIGGLIANFPLDSYHDKYGGIYNYVKRIEVVLANGDVLQTLRYKKYALAKKTTEKTFEGDIYNKLTKSLKKNEKLIKKIDTSRLNLTGYPMVIKASHRETVDLLPLFFGSQGTLGIISEVILSAVPRKTKSIRLAATFKELDSAISFMDKLKPLKPREMNLYDLKIAQEAREAGKNLDGIIKKLDSGYVTLMTFDEHQKAIMRKLVRLKEKSVRGVRLILDTQENQTTLNELSNALSIYMTHPKKGERIPVLTNFYIPAANLKGFVEDLKIIEDKLGLDLALFGSYSAENYSLRPKFDFADENVNKKIATFLRAGAYVIKRQGGYLTGGSPEGRWKAVVANGDLLEPERAFYSELKHIFDPNGILNPDVKLGANTRFTLTHLRKSESKTISS